MKKLISSLLISTIILMSGVIANAANVANLTFSGPNSVDVDSEIAISLEITGLTGISELYAVAGVLEYDENIFELVSVSGKNGWKVSQGNKIAMISDNPVTSGEIITVVLRAKNKPENGSTALTLKNVSVTDNIDEFDQSDVTYTINVKDKVVTPENPTPENPTPENPTPDNPAPENPTPENPTPNPDDTPSGSTSGGSVQNTPQGQNQIAGGNVANDTTVSKVKLPAAGLNITIAILIILGIVIGTASFLRYKRIKLK